MAKVNISESAPLEGLSQNEELTLTPQERRSARRKRRIRNQILAYLALIVVMALIGFGFFTVFKITKDYVVSRIEEMKATQEAEAEPEITPTPTVELVQPKEPEEEYTEEDLLEEVVQSCIQEMSLEDKVAGLFIISPEQLTGVTTAIKAGDSTKAALEKYPVGGLVYSEKNIQTSNQIKEMIGNTVSYSKYPIFLALNEGLGEKGALRKSLKLDKIDSAKKFGESADAATLQATYKSIGEYLTTYGFNMNLSLSGDILSEKDGAKLGDGSFGTDSALVTDMLKAALMGMEDTGVTAVIGHFPGQGAVDKEPSSGLAKSDKTAEEVRSTEIAPFIGAIEAGANVIMVGSFALPGITGDETTLCCMSKEVITDLLRNEYQYNGVVITDALNVPGITEYYDADEVVLKALKAGADMLLLPENFEKAYNAVVEAVADGTISEQRINDSLARVYRIKYASTVEE